MRQVSMATRDEILKDLVGRYAEATRGDRGRILDEVAAITGVNAGLIPGQRGGVKPGQWVWC